MITNKLIKNNSTVRRNLFKKRQVKICKVDGRARVFFVLARVALIVSAIAAIVSNINLHNNLMHKCNMLKRNKCNMMLMKIRLTEDAGSESGALARVAVCGGQA